MKLLNFGSCNIDYVYMLDHIVNVGETESTQNLSTFCGGKGLNQSIACARAGAKVYHAGCIGEDGQSLLQLLEENGIDTRYIKRAEGKNGHAIIQVTPAGENSIFIFPGSNAKITKEDVDLTLANFEAGDVILLQNEISNLGHIVKKAKQKGLKIILNPSPINEKITELDLNDISILILNEIEAKMLTGESEPSSALEYFKKNYPALSVVLTLGSYGSFYQLGEEKIYQNTYKVEVVDSTAAGDTFTGYLVAEIIKGTKIKDALQIASCAAAISVTRHGAAPSIPTYSEVKKAIKVLEPRQQNVALKMVKEKIEEYVDANISTVCLQDVADLLGYSAVYTSTLIKKLTNLSYRDYLLDRRLVKAEQMIKETDMSIGEIIFNVGYQNENYFRKKFAKKYGKNPLEYRKGRE